MCSRMPLHIPGNCPPVAQRCECPAAWWGTVPPPCPVHNPPRTPALAHETTATLALPARPTAMDVAIEALNRIASWGEGPEVTGKFDEPSSARIAREALASIRGGT